MNCVGQNSEGVIMWWKGRDIDEVGQLREENFQLTLLFPSSWLSDQWNGWTV